jgi:hypothetical protein
MAKFYGYLRALKDQIGLGQMLALPTGLSPKGLRSANVADFFAVGGRTSFFPPN